MNYNKCILVGHLTKEIETAFTQTGTEYAKCGIAVNSGYGEKVKVMFIDFTAWGKTAQFLAKNFSKGKCILLEGEIQLDTWEKDGKKNYKHSLNVQNVGFAGGEKKDESAAVVGSENKQVDDETIPF